jgi:hypothetical protein
MKINNNESVLEFLYINEVFNYFQKLALKERGPEPRK